MATLDKFLSESDRNRIREQVKAAESKTSGEIVPMIVESSHHYPEAENVGAFAGSLMISLALSPFLAKISFFGNFFWDQELAPVYSQWLLAALIILLFPLCRQIIKKNFSIKKLFITPQSSAAEVKEGAYLQFYLQGLNKTAKANGILIYISLLEHQVYILADQGINDKVDKNFWNKIAGELTSGIKAGKGADAICLAIQQCQAELTHHFPWEKGDKNELKDLIIGN